MKVLIAAASKHDATQEIAQAIGRTLDGMGLANDVRRIEDVDDLDDFDAVVLGSAVYFGSWMDAAKQFVEEHTTALRSRPVWLFSSGPLGDPPHPNEDRAVRIDEIVAATGAWEHRVFTGRLDKRALNFVERAVVPAVHAPEGDSRDWDDVAEWSTEIARSLGA